MPGSLTIAELREKCRQKGIKGYSKLNKVQLEALCKRKGSSLPRGSPTREEKEEKEDFGNDSEEEKEDFGDEKRTVFTYKKCLMEFSMDRVKELAIQMYLPVSGMSKKDVCGRLASLMHEHDKTVSKDESILGALEGEIDIVDLTGIDEL